MRLFAKPIVFLGLALFAVAAVAQEGSVLAERNVTLPRDATFGNETLARGSYRISLNDVNDTESAPYILEGAGQNALKIYFESEANKLEYINTPLHGSDDMSGLKNIYDDMADNPNTGSIN